MADNKADQKAAAARKAERDQLNRDTDRRLAALDRSAHNRRGGKK